MKIDKSVAIINAILFGLAILFLFSAGFDGSSLGLLAILISVVNCFMVLVYSIAGKRNAMLNSLIIAGILFTIGFSVCSGSRFNMH